MAIIKIRKESKASDLRELQNYLDTHPKVVIVNRNTVGEDEEIEIQESVDFLL